MTHARGYYKALPQHAGPHFFKEQIGWLEIAVAEGENMYKNRLGNLNITGQNNQNTPFELTLHGKLYKWLKEQNRFVSYAEMGEWMGRPSKYAVKQVSTMDKKGIPMQKKMEKGRMVVKIL